MPKKCQNGDGWYGNNDKLLNEYVDRIKILKDLTHSMDMNFYIETHVFMVTEDPEAFAKIIDLYVDKYGEDDLFEINGDSSHYLCRGYLKGPYVDKILNKMEHHHVRMARVYGDVSAEVFDPVKDWNDKGITWDYWQFAKKGMENGLSSRVIVGESGPYHLVNDPISMDERMMPLLRYMAKYCDSEQSEFDEYNPFQ